LPVDLGFSAVSGLYSLPEGVARAVTTKANVSESILVTLRFATEPLKVVTVSGLLINLVDSQLSNDNSPKLQVVTICQQKARGTLLATLQVKDQVLIPEPCWLTRLNITGDEIRLSGFDV
jgi:hypothetical protein